VRAHPEATQLELARQTGVSRSTAGRVVRARRAALPLTGMTRGSGNGRSRRTGMAYFIRRRGDDCSVIALHPDDKEEIVASRLPIGEAEDLCASKIEAMRNTGTALALFDSDTAPEPLTRRRRRATAAWVQVRMKAQAKNEVRVGPGSANCKGREQPQITGIIGGAPPMGQWIFCDFGNYCFHVSSASARLRRIRNGRGGVHGGRGCAPQTVRRLRGRFASYVYSAQRFSDDYRRDVTYADGKLAAEWTRPIDDELAAYLHRYRPFGLENESTYFYNIVNLLSKNVESTVFRSSLKHLRHMFSGRHMNETQIKIEANDVVLNCDRFFMDWLKYHRDPEAIQRVDALHTILPLGFTEAVMMTVMSEKTGAISRVAHYAKAFIE
jgi:hypothetical protein